MNPESSFLSWPLTDSQSCLTYQVSDPSVSGEHNNRIQMGLEDDPHLLRV